MGWRLKVSLERDDQDGLAVPSLGILSVGTAGQWWSTVNKEQSRKGKKKEEGAGEVPGNVLESRPRSILPRATSLETF